MSDTAAHTTGNNERTQEDTRQEDEEKKEDGSKHTSSNSSTGLTSSNTSSTGSVPTHRPHSLSGMFVGGITGGAAALGAQMALQIGATGSSTEPAAAVGANGSPSVAPASTAAVMPPPPLVVSDTPTPSPQVSTTNASTQQFPTSSSFGLGLAGLAASASGAAAVPNASSAAAAALVRRPSGLTSGVMMGLAPALPPPSATVPSSAASGVAVSAGSETVTVVTSTSVAASSVIFTPSSMAQETAGQRATRSLSYSITSVAGGAASAAAVPAAPASTASILMLFDPSAVSPDLSSASNTHASSASFRFSSSASPAHSHAHPARPFSPLTSNPTAAQAAAAAAVAAGPLALAPSPVPAVSPAMRKSFTTGATATMSSIRQKIREQISGMRKEKGRRDQEEVVREWSTCLAKWNQYQPAVSGATASLNGGSGLSAKELTANQKKLSGMLLSSGIPSHMRASVWLLMIGNGLGLTPQSFEELRTSCEEKRREYELWRRQTNSNHLNAKHRHLAEAEAAAAAAASTATAASSSGAEVVPAAPSTDPSASPVSSASASMPTFHPSPSPSPSAPSLGGGSATPQSTSTIHSFDSVDVSLDPSCAMFSLIDQDLPRTFPELQFFHHDGPYETPLRVVLEATAAFRARKERERIQALAMQEMGDPALAAAAGLSTGAAPAPVFESSSASSSGYVQGMSFLASILFLALGDDDPFLAFVALTNLLENPAEPLSQLFSMRLEIMEDWLLRFDAQFLHSLPKLHAHFSGAIGLTADMYLYKWIFSVYAQSLHLDAVFRVWDCFLWESFKNRGPGAAGVASAGAGNAAAVGAATGAAASVSLGAGNAVASKGAAAAAGGSPASPASSTSATSASSSPTAAAAVAAPAATVTSAPAVSASSALHVHSGHGFPFLFRVALGILSMFSDALCAVGFEECLHFLHHLPGKAQSGSAGSAADEMLDIDLLFQHVRTIKMEPNIWGAGMANK